ncbi:MAG: HAD family phosphatase [Absicoccus porci]|uniref:HAD family hydrolase n=1 Tax=Absicoccus porci TaxID=2486576 RepID=UPI002E7A64EF|nr:HAD family phosphatase [Absicoccus porci]MEE1355517.1 HAD family phosphatase [Absicoccus porci]
MIALFDVDGVILDSMAIWDTLPIRYVRSKGKIPQTNLAKIIAPMSLEESSLYLKEHYQLNESSIEIQHEIIEMLATYYKKEVALKSGVLSCLQACQDQHMPMYVLSIGDETLINAAFKRLQIRSYFQKIFTVMDKRNPHVYENIATQLHTKPQDLLVFEDSLDAIQSAHQAGCKTIGIADPSNQDKQTLIKARADFFVPGFEAVDWGHHLLSL